MKKYFTDVKEREILLSTYAGEEKELLIDALGDIYLPESIISALAGFYHSFGGRYSVMSDADTIRGVTDIYLKHPTLSKKAVDQIGFIYIKDLFEQFELDKVLTGLIDFFGEGDDAFEIFLEVVSHRADELDEDYKLQAEKLDLFEGYGKRYIDYLKSLIIREHISVDKVIESIPKAELVMKDEQQLDELSRRTRIYFGAGYPISYKLTRMHAKDDMSGVDELFYYVSTTKEKVPATFTKEDYLKQVKQKTKEI